MEARDRLRLLSMEMELQRVWLAAYLYEREARAERWHSSAMVRAMLSVFRTRSLWLAAFGIVAEWWRHRKPRHA